MILATIWSTQMSDGSTSKSIADDMAVVVLPGVLRPPFEEWLGARGLRMVKIPDPTIEETWIITPTDEWWEAMKPESAEETS